MLKFLFYSTTTGQFLVDCAKKPQPQKMKCIEKYQIIIKEIIKQVNKRNNIKYTTDKKLLIIMKWYIFRGSLEKVIFMKRKWFGNFLKD